MFFFEFKKIAIHKKNNVVKQIINVKNIEKYADNFVEKFVSKFYQTRVPVLI
jgi:hypothetical protein